MAKHRRYNNYTLGIWLTCLAAVGIFLPLILAHVLIAGGSVPEWLLILIYGPFLISQQVAGGGYFGKFIDFLTGDYTVIEFLKDTGKYLKKGIVNFPSRVSAENIGLTLGVLGGIAIGILQIIYHVHIPFVSEISGLLAGGIFLVSCINDFGGLGNRIGRTIDFFRGRNAENKNNLLRNRHVNYALAIVAGLLIGFTLVVASFAFGATTMGVVPAILFAVTTIGICASSSGYVGRCFDFILGERTVFHALDDLTESERQTKTTFRERCTAENIGTVIGVGLGVLAGSIIIGMGIVTLPFFAIGTVKIILGITLMGMMISAGGGLGNRIGHAIDKARATKTQTVEKKPAPSLKLDPKVEKLLQNDHGIAEIPSPQPLMDPISSSDNLIHRRLVRSESKSSFTNLGSSRQSLFPGTSGDKKLKPMVLSSDIQRQQPLVFTWEKKPGESSEATNSQKHGMFSQQKPVDSNMLNRIDTVVRNNSCAAAAM